MLCCNASITAHMRLHHSTDVHVRQSCKIALNLKIVLVKIIKLKSFIMIICTHHMVFVAMTVKKNYKLIKIAIDSFLHEVE